MTPVSNKPGAINGGVRGERQAYVPVSEELIAAAQNIYDKLAGERTTVDIFDQERLGDALKSVATLRSQSPEPSSSEVVSDERLAELLERHVMRDQHGKARKGFIASIPCEDAEKVITELQRLRALSPTVSQPVTGEEVEVWKLVSQLSALAEDDTGHYPATAKKLAALAATRLSDYQALKARLLKLEGRANG